MAAHTKLKFRYVTLSYSQNEKLIKKKISQVGQTSVSEVEKRDLRAELLLAEAEAKNKKRKAEGKPPLPIEGASSSSAAVENGGDEESNKRRKLLQEALELDRDDDDDDDEEGGEKGGDNGKVSSKGAADDRCVARSYVSLTDSNLF